MNPLALILKAKVDKELSTNVKLKECKSFYKTQVVIYTTDHIEFELEVNEALDITKLNIETLGMLVSKATSAMLSKEYESVVIWNDNGKVSIEYKYRHNTLTKGE